MKHRPLTTIFIGIFAWLVIWPAAAQTQAEAPSLKGVLQTDLGVPVQNYPVLIQGKTDAGDSIKAVSTTDDSGAFAVKTLPPGKYSVRPANSVDEGRSITLQQDDSSMLGKLFGPPKAKPLDIGTIKAPVGLSGFNPLPSEIPAKDFCFIPPATAAQSVTTPPSDADSWRIWVLTVGYATQKELEGKLPTITLYDMVRKRGVPKGDGIYKFEGQYIYAFINGESFLDLPQEIQSYMNQIGRGRGVLDGKPDSPNDVTDSDLGFRFLNERGTKALVTSGSLATCQR